jgi:hypothetical protein
VKEVQGLDEYKEITTSGMSASTVSAGVRIVNNGYLRYFIVTWHDADDHPKN